MGRNHRGQSRGLLAVIAAWARPKAVFAAYKGFDTDESSFLQSFHVVERRQEASGAIVQATGELDFLPTERGNASLVGDPFDAAAWKAEPVPLLLLASGDRKLCNGTCIDSGSYATRPASVVADEAGATSASVLEALDLSLRQLLDGSSEAARRQYFEAARKQLGGRYDLNRRDAQRPPQPGINVGYRAQQLFVMGSWYLFILLTFMISIMVTLAICNCVGPCVVPCFPSSKILQTRPRVCYGCCALGLSLVLTFFTCLAMHLCLRHRLEFIHIPKCAGTTVEELGVEQGGVRWSAESFRFIGRQRMKDGSRCNRYHVPPQELTRRWDGRWAYDYATTFCITRHPFDRMVSEYRYLASTDWARDYYEQYDNGLFDYPLCTVEGLNHFIQTLMQQYKRTNCYIDDCHIVPMHEYVWDGQGNQLCNHVLSTENLTEEFNELMLNSGYPLTMTHATHSNEARSCDVSVSDLDEESRNRITSVYAMDFLLFNYSHTRV